MQEKYPKASKSATKDTTKRALTIVMNELLLILQWNRKALAVIYYAVKMAMMPKSYAFRAVKAIETVLD